MLLTSGDAPFCSSSRTMFRWPMKAATWMGVKPDWNQEENIHLLVGGRTSVMDWMEAPYLTSSSITFTRFFLQAMCSGVKPFCHVGTVKDEQPGHVEQIYLLSVVICVSYQSPGVGVGPLVQQQLGDPEVTAVRRHVERRQVVQRDVVHRGLVLQEVLDAFDVVALSRHVERG
ncbi:hypothetical protein EYF80_046870 [Liparis tanakae]|uniref:Uncharacterized protein n=1 Tax=Liparis tanakae TaxID=230148 RepID=A0A4Z2FP87_9TELE|nr:hypothetical protein EYF80_046870 [Liparis tanakae]